MTRKMVAARTGVLLLVVVPLGLLGISMVSSQTLPATGGQEQLDGRVATEAQLQHAEEEWVQTKHADTFDNGMGANTTCARCKSPLNWDPGQDLAQQQAMDCGSCKRIPGAPRPELTAGIQVNQEDWRSIGCEICHQPVGDSFLTEISYWNQRSGEYEPVESVMELCAKCHEGRHGFQVVEEQESSEAHSQWECTICHGPHSQPSSCTDCHEPTTGSGAIEHRRHPSVNCTGCHDAGGLTVWRDPEAGSAHKGTYITRRFAHTLTSWPSHNLASNVDCTLCHHPIGDRQSSIVPEVSCRDCHENGAVLFWCEYFPRDPSPYSQPGLENGFD